jgi:hypothetical protein
MSQATPQIYDLPQLHRQMIEVLGIKNADKLVPTKDDITPADPVSENMSILVGKPVKAFIYQDQDAHIQTHQAFLQDPQIAAFVGQNPAAQQVVAALQAHMAEHVAFSYRRQIEERLGAPLPLPEEELPELMEENLSRMLSEAAIELSKQKQAAAAQQQAQQQAQDPAFQQKQAELQLKQGELQRKAAKDAMDGALDQERLELERKKAATNATLEANRIAAQNQAAEAKNDIDEAKTMLDMAKAAAEDEKNRAEARRAASEAERDNREDR